MLDCRPFEAAHVYQGGQAVQAPHPDLYNLLGIESLEMGGRLTDWDTGFERKLRSIFDEADLGIKYSGHVFPLGESFLRMLGY